MAVELVEQGEVQRSLLFRLRRGHLAAGAEHKLSLMREKEEPCKEEIHRVMKEQRDE